ncbi:MAG TPA: prolipoprotein diacylglyceryl transferase [Bryobacteraceae bacterium]|nr:prolipoprotein diacylglyceryl transferase [Bryobacteraceae bacterium]
MFPKLFTIGSFYLPTYGVLVALAFLVALTITVHLARKSHLDGELITNLAVYCALAGLAGAKLLMLVFDFDYYRQHPSEIFSLSTMQAAGVFQGGLVLAILTAVLYMRRHGLPFLLSADAFSPGIAIGHSIGRLGCFAAGCCWGKECSLPWAVTFRNPAANQLVGVPLNVPLHPTQLYELITEAIVFAILYWRFGRPHRAGEILGLYLILSSSARFVIEFYRFHEQALPFGLPFSITQWIALALLAIGLWLLVRARHAGAAVRPTKAQLIPAK